MRERTKAVALATAAVRVRPTGRRTAASARANAVVQIRLNRSPNVRQGFMRGQARRPTKYSWKVRCRNPNASTTALGDQPGEVAHVLTESARPPVAPRTALSDRRCIRIVTLRSAGRYPPGRLSTSVSPGCAAGSVLLQPQGQLDQVVDRPVRIEARRGLQPGALTARRLPVDDQGTHIAFVKLDTSVGQLAHLTPQQGQHGQQQRVRGQPFDAGVAVHVIQQQPSLDSRPAAKR